MAKPQQKVKREPYVGNAVEPVEFGEFGEVGEG